MLVGIALRKRSRFTPSRLVFESLLRSFFAHKLSDAAVLIDSIELVDSAKLNLVDQTLSALLRAVMPKEICLVKPQAESFFRFFTGPVQLWS